MRITLLFLIHFMLAAAGTLHAQVWPGIDELVRQNFAPLQGKRVGLVVNRASVCRNATQHTIDAFIAARQCTIVALFGPEHGVDGKTGAGGTVSNSTDPRTGAPVYSLYGPTRTPTKKMLEGVDVMVYDMQDIGVRSYTFISTLVNVMTACAAYDIPLVVLDRPNPIGGNVIDGQVLDTAFRSFVGIAPVPYVYGLTPGELAAMVNGEGWLPAGARCSLTVVRMKGWRRDMTWTQTGLKWVPTSPNIPTPQAAFGCAVTGAIGELRIAHVGIGSDLPFQMVATDWMNGARFAAGMNARKVRGIRFKQLATSAKGVRLIRGPGPATPFTACVALLCAMRDARPEGALLKDIPKETWAMFNKVCGSDKLGKALLHGDTYDSITASWQPALRAYIAKRQPYLLYQ